MSKEDDTWDGINIHYCTLVYQSAPSATMACGIELSTWSGPNAKGTSVEDSVGYTFSKEKVTCPECFIKMGEYQ